MSTVIYWFSGTGNSLYAAKRLAELIGNAVLAPIASENPPSEGVGGGGQKIGFVFPSYYGDLPRIVRAFADKLNILPGTDIFTVVTMGALGQGSVGAMEELLAAKSLSLRYGVGVRMPANYILAYDPALFGAKSVRRVNAKLSRADRKLQAVANEISGGVQRIKTNSITAKTLYTGIPALDSAFTVTDGCTGCGLCERICPAGNIELANGRPVWQHRCEHCVACISWCPASAIEYGQKTGQRTRYRNPNVKSIEIERARG